MTDYIYADQWEQYLDSISDVGDGADYTEELDWWNTIMSARDQQSFAIGGVPGGEAWPQWELQTWRTWQRGGHDTLVTTERLMNSLVRGGNKGVDEVNARESMFGTEVPYAHKHQTGGTFLIDDDLYNRDGKRVKRAGDEITIPERPFATLTDQMIDGLADLVSDSLVEQMKG